MSTNPTVTTPAPTEGDTAARRAHVHAMWAAVAPNWADHADSVDDRLAAVTAALLDGAGLAAAERVGPTGAVVLTDVVDEMVAIAATRAAARGVTNVRTAVRDLEAIDEPDGAYDAVLCREGFMFAVEPERAAGEVH